MIVGLAGVAISLIALPFSSIRMTSGRFLIAVSLLALHLAAAWVYFLYAQHNVADSNRYYFDVYNTAASSFGLSTVFTIKFTQFLKHTLGGSYFECFLFFQSLGFLGIVILMRLLQEIEEKTSVNPMITPLILLFLPSLHFWTAAVGKDAPVFLGICLCFWAALELRKRRLTFGLGIATVLLFRPHIALAMAASLGVGAFLHRKMSLGRKAMLLAVAIAGAFLLAGLVKSTFGIDVTDVSSVADFVDERNDVAARATGGTAIGDAPIYTRLLSLLFRPFFYDAQNAMGMVASLENVFIFLITIYLVKNWMGIRFLSKRVFFIEFSIVYLSSVLVILVLTYYNVGLGLRQRIMIFPALFSILVGQMALQRTRSSKFTRPAMNGLLFERERSILQSETAG